MLKKKTLGQAVRYAIYGALTASFLPLAAKAADVAVDVNVNMKHSVVYDGKEYNQLERSRRFALHARSLEPGWDGELAKMDYLVNDLDVYFARDTGQITTFAQFTNADKESGTARTLGYPVTFPDLYLKHSSESLETLAKTWKEFDLVTNKADKVPFMGRAKHMIMGAQPRHFVPSWSDFSHYNNGGYAAEGWRSRNNADAADWVADYIDNFFSEGTPQLMPEYWEVVNEPDMEVFNENVEGLAIPWADLFSLHSDVAEAVRERLGSNAPKIGGMTWGLHDFNKPDSHSVNRRDSAKVFFQRRFINPNPAEQNEYNQSLFDHIIDNNIFGALTEVNGSDTDWFQWDYLWAPFVDSAGADMDFYSVHLYDWPEWGARDSQIRSGGHSEAVLDMMEWYSLHKLNDRKEVVISEYGAVSGVYKEMNLYNDDFDRRDWENLMPFSQMLLQFLERPDYVPTSLPFTPIKAEVWFADYGPYQPYPYTMMDRNIDTCTERPDVQVNNGTEVFQALDCKEWEWSEWIKWYELWADVDGTRVDTHSSDKDIQVDAYQKDNRAYIVINSLETTPKTVSLSLNGGGQISSVRLRHLYLDENLGADGRPVLADAELGYIPSSITVDAGSTVILDVSYSGNIALNEDNKESKFMFTPYASEFPHRVSASGTANAEFTLTPGDIPSNGEAQLRLSGSFARDALVRGNYEMTVELNGNAVDINKDFRGEFLGTKLWKGQSLTTLEIPFDTSMLKAGTNTVSINSNLVGEHTSGSVQIWNLSSPVSRSTASAAQANLGALSGPSSVGMNQSVAINPGTTDTGEITWTSSNAAVASVDPNGVVTGNSIGSATITASAGGSQKTHSIQVAKVPVESIEVKSHEQIYAGFETSVYARVYPVKATNARITWSSSDTSIAEIDERGIITSYKEGDVTFTATSKDDPSISGQKTVSILGVQAESMSVGPVGRLAPIGLNVPLAATVQPILTSDKTFTWTSSDESVATVSDTGIVSGVSPGVVTITITSNSNPSLTETLTFEAVQPGEPIVIQAEDTGLVTSNGLMPDGNDPTKLGFNQPGDSLDVKVDFKEEGIYLVTMMSSTPESDPNVHLFLEGNLVARAPVIITGDWGVFTESLVTSELEINSAGEKTLKFQSAGDSAYQWNVDFFTITRLGSTQGGNSSIPSSSSTPVTVSSSSSESSSIMPSSSSVVSSSVISSVASSSEVASSSVVVIASTSSSAAISSSSVATSSSLVSSSSAPAVVSSSSAPAVVSSSSASSSSEPITPATEITVSQVATSASDITPGSQDVEVLKFDMQSNVDGAMLKALTIKASGEMDDVSALSNVTLLYGNTVLQNANYSVDNGMITFDLSASPVVLNRSGNATFTIIYDFN